MHILAVLHKAWSNMPLHNPGARPRGLTTWGQHVFGATRLHVLSWDGGLETPLHEEENCL